MSANRLAALALAGGLACVGLVPGAAQAMGKKSLPPAPLSGKRVIRLDPVRNVRIEMPDQQFHDFGDDFAQKLEGDLFNSGRYVVDNPPVLPLRAGLDASRAAPLPPPDTEWPGSEVPAARLSITVEAMSFQTGAGGDRMFYGFNERFRTPFNDGFSDQPNEFPLRPPGAEPGWFGAIFNTRGVTPFDSRSGLDLGDGFQVNALFAWLAVKYATYHAELHLRLDLDAPLAGLSEYRLVTVTGEGYFFDIAGAYEGYSLGISVARRDAMGQAMTSAINGAYAAIDRAIAPLPLTARIDGVLADGTILLGTGPNAAVVPGTLYELIDHPEAEVRLQAILSNSSGTLAKVAQGDPTLAVAGGLAREALPGLPAPLPAALALEPRARALAEAAPAGGVPAAVESIALPWSNLAQADLTGLIPTISWLEAFWKSLVEAIFLPYRIWRYFQYDQSYSASTTSLDEKGTATAVSEPTDQSPWSRQARGQAWARQIGLDQAPPMDAGHAPIVAVIDGGVDYNHWTIHDHLWLNPSPLDLGAAGPADRKDYYGWDFISGDSHPYDDGYHGTEVASLVAAVAPASPILPLKIFNPSGITSSAAIYGAFVYAVDHGAKLIVCGWATEQASSALERAVDYAQGHGVGVIAAAGDLGTDLSRTPSYPAALSARYDNVLAVAGVTASDALVQASGGGSNYDARGVGLAAPGQGIRVATPRGELTSDTSTGLAAALTAGALARLLAADSATAAQGPAAWIQVLRAEADSLPALDGGVAGGLRLHVRH